MKANLIKSTLIAVVVCLTLGLSFTSCDNTDDPYLLRKEDIKVEQPVGGFTTKVDQLLKIEVIVLGRWWGT